MQTQSVALILQASKDHCAYNQTHHSHSEKLSMVCGNLKQVPQVASNHSEPSANHVHRGQAQSQSTGESIGGQ